MASLSSKILNDQPKLTFDFAATFKCSTQRQFVGVFQVATHR
jgi:hypothetical protein